MDYKSKCVNLLNKLAYEVCNVKKDQVEIIEKININNEILLFNNSLTQEIINVGTSYQVKIEVYDLGLTDSNKIFLYLLCQYLNTLDNYNFYFPSYINQSFVNANMKSTITRVVLIPTAINTLRELMNFEGILENIRYFVDYLEEESYNSKSTLKHILNYLENIESAHLVNHIEKTFNKPSLILKEKDMIKEKISNFINNNVSRNNLVHNLYSELNEIIEVSKLELIEGYIRDVNNPYRQEVDRKKIIQNSHKFINRNDINVMDSENCEPFEPSDIFTFTDTDTLQNFENTNDDTIINTNKDIFNKLKNILDISTNTETDNN
jgi:hypothetical protein